MCDRIRVRENRRDQTTCDAGRNELLTWADAVPLVTGVVPCHLVVCGPGVAPGGGRGRPVLSLALATTGLRHRLRPADAVANQLPCPSPAGLSLVGSTRVVLLMQGPFHGARLSPECPHQYQKSLAI